ASHIRYGPGVTGGHQSRPVPMEAPRIPGRAGGIMPGIFSDGLHQSRRDNRKSKRASTDIYPGIKKGDRLIFSPFCSRYFIYTCSQGLYQNASIRGCHAENESNRSSWLSPSHLSSGTQQASDIPRRG